VIFISSESALNFGRHDSLRHDQGRHARPLRGLAKRAAGTGVTVNAILPGPTLSEGVRRDAEKEDGGHGRSLDEVAAAFVAAQRPSSIIRRPASTEEVANMVVYAPPPGLGDDRRRASRRCGVVDTIA